MSEKIDLTKELIFSSSDPNISRRITKAEKEGIIRKLAPRIYTANLVESKNTIIKRNFLDIITFRFPNAVISHRSAYELKPTEDNNFFITSSYTKKITDIPGFTINVQNGPKALDSDVSFNGINISSEYRWMLENMQISKLKGGRSKLLPVDFIENRLENIIIREGEEKLNRYRDKLREIAGQSGMNAEFEKLNSIISALLQTHDSKVLHSKSAIARASGLAYDAKRAELFEKLFHRLKDYYFIERPEKTNDEDSYKLFSFFESYFSNYIEGTKFDVDEAKRIIDTGIPVPLRIKDSHDILGTFGIVSNKFEMSKTPSTEDEFIEIIKNRHHRMMANREEANPGQFKTVNNRAGNTEFVDHTLVEGTLRYGFKYYAALNDPVAKAIFMMYLISEVHPFTDGNGRLSRIMGNAELVKANLSRIIVPTVYREDYLGALKRLSHQGDPDVFIRVMEKLHKFSDNIYGNDYTELKSYLKECNAYEEPTKGKLKILERTFNDNNFDDLDIELEKEKKKRKNDS